MSELATLIEAEQQLRALPPGRAWTILGSKENSKPERCLRRRVRIGHVLILVNHHAPRNIPAALRPAGKLEIAGRTFDGDHDGREIVGVIEL